MITFTFLLHNYHVVSWQPIESKRNENVNERQLSGSQVMSSLILARVSILLLRVSWFNMHQRPIENSSAQHTNFHKFFFLTRMKIVFYPFEAFLNDGTTGKKKGHTLIPFVFVARAFSRFSLWFLRRASRSRRAERVHRFSGFYQVIRQNESWNRNLGCFSSAGAAPEDSKVQG